MLGASSSSTLRSGRLLRGEETHHSDGEDNTARPQETENDGTSPRLFRDNTNLLDTAVEDSAAGDASHLDRERPEDEDKSPAERVVRRKEKTSSHRLSPGDSNAHRPSALNDPHRRQISAQPAELAADSGYDMVGAIPGSPPQLNGMRRRRALDVNLHRVFRPPAQAPGNQNIDAGAHQPRIYVQNERGIPRTLNMRTKAPLYDGTSSWTDYLVQFELVAELNGWDQGSMAMHLATSLRGAAQSVLGDLDNYGRRDYRTLVTSLGQRFGPENQTQMFRALLRNRTRQPNETLPELAHEIRRLVKLAYPTGQQVILEDLAMNHFIDALPEMESRWHIQQSRPRTIDEAVRVAVELEAFHAAEKHRGATKKMVRVVQPDVEIGRYDRQEQRLKQTEDAILQVQHLMDKGFQALEEKLSRMSLQKTNYRETDRRRDFKGSSRPKQVECYHCGELGHIRPECEKFREERNGFKRSDDRKSNQGN